MDGNDAGSSTSVQETLAADLVIGATSTINRIDSNGSGGSSSAFNKNRPLAKSNSVVSHKSIPFLGAYPIGHLKAHQVPVVEADSPDDCNGVEAKVVANSPGTHPTIHGDTFVLLSLPNEAHVGCDSTALVVKKTADAEVSFLGFRNLPPGAHLVWLSAPGVMIRQGYWFVTRPPADSASASQHGAVRIKQWDRYNEVLGECASQYEAQSLATDLSSIYPRLLAYNSKISAEAGNANKLSEPSYPSSPLPNGRLASSEAGLWSSLVSCISEELLARVMAGGRIAAEPIHTEWPVSTNDTVQGEMAIPLRSISSQLWGNSGGTEFTFYFSKDDVDPYRLLASRDKAAPASSDGASTFSETPSTTATHRTEEAGLVDTTERIAVLLQQQAPHGLCDKDLVGELQFAFLTGTLLCNLSCLEQWWHLVLKVYLRAHSLVTRRPVLCRMVFQTLHDQFLFLERHVAGGFLGHSSSTGRVNSTADALSGAADAGGASLFEAKPHGAMRLQASLTDFKRHLNETLLGLGKAASADEAAAGEAFASLEASLWKYGWDLRSDYASGGSGNNSSGMDGNDDRGGRLGDPADRDDSDGEMDYYEEAIQRTTSSRREPHRHHTGLSDTDSDSDQPVLVELDQDGREIGLVSWK
ncbi:hypothetical protein SEPCBS119000_004322 [Sporothrix epigloea]|uniref:Uncharacterized protein n=1 Tax=Sporothrix epigloea TaxID=1892477 RepID=A0ABP0DRI0_9PEZI